MCIRQRSHIEYSKTRVTRDMSRVSVVVRRTTTLTRRVLEDSRRPPGGGGDILEDSTAPTPRQPRATAGLRQAQCAPGSSSSRKKPDTAWQSTKLLTKCALQLASEGIQVPVQEAQPH
jgi:hypothetical protein